MFNNAQHMCTSVMVLGLCVSAVYKSLKRLVPIIFMYLKALCYFDKVFVREIQCFQWLFRSFMAM